MHSHTRSAGIDGVAETETNAKEGAGGAASSSSATSTHLNAAGGVTQAKRKVQSVNTTAGSAHKVTDSTSATTGDGTSTTIKKESEVTTP